MLVPKEVEYPLGVVHFVGGQGVGVFPKSAYGTLLEALADAGVCVPPDVRRCEGEQRVNMTPRADCPLRRQHFTAQSTAVMFEVVVQY